MLIVSLFQSSQGAPCWRTNAVIVMKCIAVWDWSLESVRSPRKPGWWGTVHRGAGFPPGRHPAGSYLSVVRWLALSRAVTVVRRNEMGRSLQKPEYGSPYVASPSPCSATRGWSVCLPESVSEWDDRDQRCSSTFDGHAILVRNRHVLWSANILDSFVT